ncbi:hypothetical protein AQI88_30230 [Streptomyces cellostaticus]|uniref:Uncharacterized protein n=1 Tax=Streptomyces cellostaticus TaxID=67285 RepID=A0A101NGZ1_9ACTN|nr:hypothetical protein [Streptomyces cellostaticus]KUM92834.1 hypothetical protein AQI88_30230 [Streptomyces cellostaticus]
MDNPTTPTTRRTTRLLPWSGPEGKPCYLLTDDSRGGRLSRLADSVESIHLGMGDQLLGHARALINHPRTGPVELRYLSTRLTESLRDVLRVAKSRGARLPVPDSDGDDPEREPEDDNRL